MGERVKSIYLLGLPAWAALAAGACTTEVSSLSSSVRGRGDQASIDNLHPHANPNGAHATFSTRGFIDQTGAFFRPQGTNGRSCATCHIAEDVWGINPATIQRLFDETGGQHPIFNPLDANNPQTNDFTTVEGRRAAYSTMLAHGVFRRGGAPRATREWDLIAVDDPNGFASTDRLVHWRRVMPTINFPLGSTRINWDGGNQAGVPPTIRAGLENQASRNVTGAQQGSPAAPEVIQDIVDFEIELFAAQTIVQGVGDLVENGSTSGPEQLASQARVAGRFDLFDAWIGNEHARRAQIARGQELFNNTNAGGRRCGACHNSVNNGTNINNTMFNISTAIAAKRLPWQTLHTFRHRTTGQHGCGRRTGNRRLWCCAGTRVF